LQSGLAGAKDQINELEGKLNTLRNRKKTAAPPRPAAPPAGPKPVHPHGPDRAPPPHPGEISHRDKMPMWKRYRNALVRGVVRSRFKNSSPPRARARALEPRRRIPIDR
jgi:hypothetical protein